MEGLKALDPEGIEALFNLTAKKRAKWYINEVEIEKDRWRFSVEPVDVEEDAEDVGHVAWEDEIFIALRTERGNLFIPLSPLKHIKAENRRYAVRWVPEGEPIVAVYGDVMVHALVMPVYKEFAGALRCMAGRMAAPMYVPEEEVAADAEARAEKLAALIHVTTDDGEKGRGDDMK